MQRVWRVCALLSLAWFGACSGTGGGGDGESETVAGDGDGDPGWSMVESELPRDIHPMPTPEEMAALAEDQLALALDLYHALRADPTNQSFCVSAVGLQHGLGMLYGGGTGPAKAQMQAGLHYSLADDRQHIALNWQALELEQRNLDAVDLPGQDQDPLVLRMANGVWLTQVLGDAIETDYLDLLAVNYGTGVYLADFSSEQSADAERQAINMWISERTDGRISALFPSGTLSAQTTAVVASALYLAAPWTAPFAVDKTTKHDFKLDKGGKVAVDMMSNPALEARYGDGAGYSALAIPLRGIALEVVFVVPEGKLEEFEAGLDAASVTALLDDLSWELVDTHVPRFQLLAKLQLTSVFSNQLGMPGPFSDPQAFSGVVADGIGVLDDVFHDSVIEVDERGVEAAAAIGDVTISATASEPSHAFWVNQPFMVMIHDRPTRSVLLLGRVLDPRGPEGA